MSSYSCLSKVKLDLGGELCPEEEGGSVDDEDDVEDVEDRLQQGGEATCHLEEGRWRRGMW